MTRGRCSGSTRRFRASLAGIGIGTAFWCGGQAVAMSTATAEPVDSSSSTSSIQSDDQQSTTPDQTADTDLTTELDTQPSSTAETDVASDPTEPTTPEQTPTEEPSTATSATSEEPTTDSGVTVQPTATQDQTPTGADMQVMPSVSPSDSPTTPTSSPSSVDVPPNSLQRNSDDAAGTDAPAESATPYMITASDPLEPVASQASPNVVGEEPAPVTTDHGVRVVNAPTQFVATLLSVLGFNPLAAADPPRRLRLLRWYSSGPLGNRSIASSSTPIRRCRRRRSSSTPPPAW